MAKFKPQLRSTETYTQSNFIRLHTAVEPHGAGVRRVTIEHLCYRPLEDTGWRCATVVDGEPMSKEDAVFIALCYAEQHRVPVIYECHSE